MMDTIYIKTEVQEQQEDQDDSMSFNCVEVSCQLIVRSMLD